MLEYIQTLFSGDSLINDNSLSRNRQEGLTKKDGAFFELYHLGASLTFSVDPSAEVWWSINGRYDFFSYGKLPGRISCIADSASCPVGTYENSPAVYRWVLDKQLSFLSPVGTTDTVCS